MESSQPGKSLRNAAGAIKVALPATVGAGSASVESGGESVETTLISAGTGPAAEPSSPPVSEEGVALPVTPSSRQALQPATDAEAPQVEANKASYSSVFPGVDVAYTTLNDGLKEDLILNSAEVPTDYDFKLKLSPGLSAEQMPAGEIVLKDDAGVQWGQLTKPFVHEGTFPGTTPLEGVSYDAVSMKIVATSPELIVRVSILPEYLASANRQFPLTIDPSMLVGSVAYTFITADAPTSNYDTHTLTAVCVCPGAYRTLAKPIPDLVNFFKEPVEIISASMTLNSFDSTGAAVKPVGVYEITSDWYGSQATWNQGKTGVNWTTPGGDIAAQPETILANITGAAGPRTWSIMSMVKAWAKGERPYYGAMVKYVNDTQAAPAIYFDGADAAFSIAWMPQLGLHAPFTYEPFQLGESRQGLVNIVSGSLKISEADLSLAGTGLNAGVERGYDSRAGQIASSSMGSFWTMWPGGREKLYPQANGDVIWLGGPERELLFERNSDASYRSPQGYRGHLSKLGNGTYTVNLHDSGMVYAFGASNQIDTIKDRNGNTVRANYVYDGPSGEYMISSLTDTKNRVTTVTHSGPGKVSMVTDPSGRQYKYGYNAAGQINMYTDPAGKITTYEYDLPGAAFPPLTKIIDPNNNQTRFGYTSVSSLYPPGSGVSDLSYRLTSLTRVTDLVAGTGYTTSFEYLPWDAHFKQGKTKVTDPNQKVTTYTFDKLGRVFEVLDPLGKTVKASYTAAGFLLNQTDQAGKVVKFGYDGSNNVTEVRSPTQSDPSVPATQAFSYGSHPYYPDTSTNAQANIMAYEYTSAGSRKKATSQVGNQTPLTVDYNDGPSGLLDGTVNSTTDGLGNITTFSYLGGDLQTVSRPLGVGDQSFEYDAISRLKKVTDAKGQATSFIYDALDRVTETTFAGGSKIINVYDDGGRLAQRQDKSGPGAQDPVHVTTFGYDRLNRQTTKTTPNTLLGVLGSVTFTSTFDGVGNLKSITDTSGVVGYEYDAANRLTALVEPGGARTSFEYDLAYRRNNVIYPNGVNQKTVFDDDGKCSA